MTRQRKSRRLRRGLRLPTCYFPVLMRLEDRLPPGDALSGTLLASAAMNADFPALNESGDTSASSDLWKSANGHESAEAHARPNLSSAAWGEAETQTLVAAPKDAAPFEPGLENTLTLPFTEADIFSNSTLPRMRAFRPTVETEVNWASNYEAEFPSRAPDTRGSNPDSRFRTAE